MDFQEKVRRLVGSRNKSALSRQAGLPETAFDAAVNKGREPLASNAVRIASVLGVSADWLFDDSKDWPPPEASEVGSLDTVPDAKLIHTLTMRCADFLEFARKTLSGVSRERGPDGRLKLTDQQFKAIKRAYDSLEVQARDYSFAGFQMSWAATAVLGLCKDVRVHVLGIESPGNYGKPLVEALVEHVAPDMKDVVVKALNEAVTRMIPQAKIPAEPPAADPPPARRRKT